MRRRRCEVMRTRWGEGEGADKNETENGIKGTSDE